MVLSIPSVEPARVSSEPCALILTNGGRYAMHAVSEALHIEAPVLDFTHCTACGCRAAIAVRGCQQPVCPTRDRKAA